MKINAVRNVEWANKEKTMIKCEVNFEEITFEEWTKFAVLPTDAVAHGRELWERIHNAKEFGEIGRYRPFVPEFLKGAPADPAVDEIYTHPTLGDYRFEGEFWGRVEK
jgi:hypothetical protein